MRITRSASRAKLSSWVTITKAVPDSRLSRFIRSNTIRPLLLSRLPVGSSAKTTAGSLASERTTATRCCWPPDSWGGRTFSLSSRPTAAEQLPHAGLLGLLELATPHPAGHQRVLQHRELRQQVVELEDEAEPVAPGPGAAQLVELADFLVLDANHARRRPVEQAHEIQQGGLARAAAADDRHEFARHDRRRKYRTAPASRRHRV